MSTQNPAENRSRQPEGAPNSTGGQFATEPKTEAPADAVATPEPIIFNATSDDIAKRNSAAYSELREAKREVHITAAAAIAQLVLEVYPNAARVRLGDSDQYDGHDIDGILDAHGKDIVDDLWSDEDYSEISDDLSEAVQDIPTTVPYSETGRFGYSWYIQEPTGHRKTTDYIDLAKAIEAYETTAVSGHLHAISHEAGNGTMSAIFDVLVDREELDDQKLLKLSADDVNELYEGFIAKSVDKLQNHIDGE